MGHASACDCPSDFAPLLLLSLVFLEALVRARDGMSEVGTLVALTHVRMLGPRALTRRVSCPGRQGLVVSTLFVE